MFDLSRIISANGFIFLTLFGALSGVSVWFIMWRVYRNMRVKENLGEFTKDFEEELQASYREARKLCEDNESAVSEVFLTALDVGPEGKVATRNAIENLIELDILPRLNFLLPSILLFSRIAPMLGLLGTVSGMIGAFGKIAGSQQANPQALANEIGMALFTTAEGLVLAIPLIFAYTVLRGRVNRTEIDLQKAAQKAVQMVPLIAKQSGQA